MRKCITQILLITPIILSLGGCCSSNKAKTCTIDQGHDEVEKVVEIKCSYYGGMQGRSASLSITEDITLYSCGTPGDELGTMRFDEPTSPETWSSLVDELDLVVFKKIGFSISNLPVDGIDTEFSVATSSGVTYSFMNGDNDQYYQQLQTFFNHVLTIHNRCARLSLPQLNLPNPNTL